MIQTADVGVGISGLEGTQAVMASDFAISKFHHLERLLLVHGNLCYNRLALTILYFFYKNTIVIFIIFFFQFACGFSGQSVLDDLYLMCINICYTTFPALVRGVYEKDCDDQIFLEYPSLYERGRKSRIYTTYSFWVNTTDSIYQSLIIYLLCYYTFKDSTIDIHQFGIHFIMFCIEFVKLLFVLSTGIILITIVVMTNWIQLALETKYWYFSLWMSYVLSFACFFGMVFWMDQSYSHLILDYFGGQNYNGFSVSNASLMLIVTNMLSI